MDAAQVEEALKVLHFSVSHIKWRLKPTTKRRLETDVLALCTGMRPVVMVDYGGKLPELQQHLCSFLNYCQKESLIFEHLRVMIIEDMIYLIHVKELGEYVRSSLNYETELYFVDLEQDPPKMMRQTDSPLGTELVSIQKAFSLQFPIEGMGTSFTCQDQSHQADAKSKGNELNSSQSSECIDLTKCLQDTQLTVPTLNGWLLGYPIVYLFGKEHIADAIYNLSTKYLHIFQIYVCRNSNNCSKDSQREELLSFSTPYELSMRGEKEQWVKNFLAHMQVKLEKSFGAWKSLHLEEDTICLGIVRRLHDLFQE